MVDACSEVTVPTDSEACVGAVASESEALLRQVLRADEFAERPHRRPPERYRRFARAALGVPRRGDLCALRP